MGDKVILEVKNLKKYFTSPFGLLHAVDDVSFKIEEGKTLGIVGESGCGKSTCGKAIIRLHEPTAGKIYYDGVDITSLNKDEMRIMRRELQIIFQDPYASLNPRKTMAQIIEGPLVVHRMYKNKGDRMKKVKKLMELVGLSKRLYNTYPHELDGGRRQRAVIARALAVDPKFIVCDEPVSALDVSIQAQILNLLQDLQEQIGLTYMFITHDLSVVKHISNEIGVMYLGKLIEKAPKKAIFEKPLHPYTKALLSAIPAPNIGKKKKRIILKGEITSPINPKPGCRFAARCRFKNDLCISQDPELIEVQEQHFVACHRIDEIITGSLCY
ncbi:ATP-binding cassette domain-containing protein [Wukongibacter baidiensis]|uniref:ABC transporter ATP-binding protein n=1 Tax=Wukongibacter baidiensis TaxID=1723361 RepID=UPI003D7FBF05